MIVDTKAGSYQSITLVPWGGVRGRVVQDDGTPWRVVNLVAGTPFGKAPQPEPVASLPQGPSFGPSLTDAEGRFEVVGLVPGMHDSSSVGSREKPFLDGLFEDQTVNAREVKDLGDLKVRPFPSRPPASK